MKYLLFSALLLVSTVKAQQYYSFNQLDSLQKVKEKKVLVFVYTNWCIYCKAMEEVVFNDRDIAHLLDEKYYLIRLNAEEKQPVIYQDSTFVFNSSLGFHGLAILLSANPKLTFPAIYILDYKNQILYQRNGFIKSKDFSKVLYYFTAKN